MRSRLELLRERKDRLSRIERPRLSGGTVVSTGVAALDGVLPRRGLEWGTLIEWLSQGESGVMALTLAIARNILQVRFREGEAPAEPCTPWKRDAYTARREPRPPFSDNKENDVLAVIDGPGEFYPPAAAGLGIALERLVLIRPRNERDALWAWEQTLRSGAVAIVLGWLDVFNDRAFRKLQLAAETGGSLAFLLRPASRRDEPSWAEARFLVSSRTRASSASSASKAGACHPSLALRAQRLCVELLYARGGAGGGIIELELSDEENEAGLVSVVSGLAHPAAAPHQARA
ncbi:MAG: hypothetical protein FJ271_24360 [Planctomycetes bacterium]|nr:hypothetical protein [Planctomycetota bacterium]